MQQHDSGSGFTVQRYLSLTSMVVMGLGLTPSVIA